MPINIARHIAEDRLELYLLGRLNRRGTKAVEEHLLCCHKCLEEAEHLDVYLKSLRSALQQLGSKQKQKVMVAGKSPTL
jgi:hypothetical protein